MKTITLFNSGDIYNENLLDWDDELDIYLYRYPDEDRKIAMKYDNNLIINDQGEYELNEDIKFDKANAFVWDVLWDEFLYNLSDVDTGLEVLGLASKRNTSGYLGGTVKGYKLFKDVTEIAYSDADDVMFTYNTTIRSTAWFRGGDERHVDYYFIKDTLSDQQRDNLEELLSENGTLTNSQIKHYLKKIKLKNY